jgi:hypothetical protein
MATNHKAKFKKAIVKAKKLYKTGRYNKFSDAVKAAYNSLPGKTRSAKKSRSVGSRPKRRAAVKSSGAVGCASIAGLKSQLRNKAKDQMRSALLSRELATTKVAKRKQTKRIQKLKTMLKTFN